MRPGATFLELQIRFGWYSSAHLTCCFVFFLKQTPKLKFLPMLTVAVTFPQHAGGIPSAQLSLCVAGDD